MRAHILPERATIEAIAKFSDDEPLVMLNLLRFRAEAAYPEGSAHAPSSGRDAYARYAAGVRPHLKTIGGQVIWMGAAQLTVIGPSDETWDEVLLVQYPSPKAFLTMASNPDYLACSEHRTAALADSRLIAMRPAERRS